MKKEKLQFMKKVMGMIKHDKSGLQNFMPEISYNSHKWTNCS